MKYSVHTLIPDGFQPTMEVASCYCEWEDKILLVKRHPQKPQGNTWGVPCGKLEKGEIPRIAVIREVREEVGLNVDDDSLREIGKLYCRLPHMDYVYHMFSKRFVPFPHVILELEEHLEMRWATFDEAFRLPLIAGGLEALNHYKSCRN